MQTAVQPNTTLKEIATTDDQISGDAQFQAILNTGLSKPETQARIEFNDNTSS